MGSLCPYIYNYKCSFDNIFDRLTSPYTHWDPKSEFMVYTYTYIYIYINIYIYIHIYHLYIYIYIYLDLFERLLFVKMYIYIYISIYHRLPVLDRNCQNVQPVHHWVLPLRQAHQFHLPRDRFKRFQHLHLATMYLHTRRPSTMSMVTAWTMAIPLPMIRLWSKSMTLSL